MHSKYKYQYINHEHFFYKSNQPICYIILPRNQYRHAFVTLKQRLSATFATRLGAEP